MPDSWFLDLLVFWTPIGAGLIICAFMAWLIAACLYRIACGVIDAIREQPQLEQQPDPRDAFADLITHLAQHATKAEINAGIARLEAAIDEARKENEQP